jgi:hypothetical protein
MDDDRFVTFSTNKSYQKYAYCLVKSLRSVYNGRILCRCVNCDDSFINFLKDNNVDVIIDNVNLSKKKKLKNCFETPVLREGLFNKNCLCDNEITYTCHSRFYNAKYILENHKNSVVALIDCDFLIIDNIDRLFDLKANDIRIMDAINCIHEDCIVVANTLLGGRFIDIVIEKLEENLFFWDQDTIALKNSLTSLTNLKIDALDLSFKDYTLSDNSVIWSGDGHAKYHKKFIDRFNKIMAL